VATIERSKRGNNDSCLIKNIGRNCSILNTACYSKMQIRNKTSSNSVRTCNWDALHHFRTQEQTWDYIFIRSHICLPLPLRILFASDWFLSAQRDTERSLRVLTLLRFLARCFRRRYEASGLKSFVFASLYDPPPSNFSAILCRDLHPRTQFIASNCSNTGRQLFGVVMSIPDVRLRPSFLRIKCEPGDERMKRRGYTSPHIGGTFSTHSGR
jgi:hypothetical protein